MDDCFDLVIVGGGPAGLSAALNGAARGCRCAVLSNPAAQSPLWRAERIDNYSGMAGVSGRAMLETMEAEARRSGAVFFPGHVTAILPFEGQFAVTVGDGMATGRRLILAIGAGAGAAFPGETELLGKGLSYCATCDGRLYRGKRVLVTGDAADLAQEAAFLERVGCGVTVVTRRPLPDSALSVVVAEKIALWTENGQLRGLEADGQRLAADGVFLLRQVSAPTALLPGLQTEGKFIAVDRQQRTNIPGCYAAGDCTGQPLQVAKAVGEGLVAAQAAARSLRPA